jgi:hypothetical protein
MLRAGTFTILAALAVWAVPAAKAAEKPPKPVPADAVAKITKAMPDRATVKPARKRKVLVFCKCRGFRHGSIPYAAKALEIMGRRTGAFQAVVSGDEAAFEPDSLKPFDAIVLNNTTGELLLPGRKELASLSADDRAAALKQAEARRKALLEFVAGGKGLVGIHAATDCSYKWKEFGEMIGGYFRGHPWHQDVAIRIDEPSHPVNAAFGGKGFTVKDEIYQFGEPYSRAKLRVLLSLDMEKTPDKGRRRDKDYAVSWVKPYGRGRVFYCSLGHRNEIFWNAAILRHYLDGIQFAIGDLKADCRPSRPPAATQAATQAARWEVLFDGNDLSLWDGKEGGWHVEDGAIAWRKGAGFLWSKKTYGDFVLSLEFNVSKGANSGIFLRTASRRNWLHSGIEVQILDSFGKEKVGRHDCGAIYDCLAPSANAVREPGEWNRIVITCQANTIAVVLNDRPIIDMDLNRWTEPHRNPDGTKNKFNTAYKDMPRAGYIGFQDHGRAVWFRDVRIRQLGE